MGIFNFFPWLRRNFPSTVTTMNQSSNFNVERITIDTFMLDGNCIYHPCAQKVFGYGDVEPKNVSLPRNISLLRTTNVNNTTPPPPPQLSQHELEQKCFNLICSTIDHLIKVVRPRKRFIMSSDGTAPLAKQFQQRCRRFKSGKENTDEQRTKFDSNCLTPGTEFMDKLSNYLHEFFSKKCKSTHPHDVVYNNLTIIYSNEKVSGEGEAKCLAKGTLILKWDGSVQTVENICVGDYVIGDDGKSRLVTELVNGESEMYEIDQGDGTKYTVNKNHILSLYVMDHKKLKWSNKRQVWIMNWYNTKKNRYKSLSVNPDTYYKCYKHTYKSDVIVMTKDEYYEISKLEAKKDALKFLNRIPDDPVVNISVQTYLKLPQMTRKKLYGYKSSCIQWEKKEVEINPYTMGKMLSDVCNSPTNHIPLDYIINDENTRLEVLAGLIDNTSGVYFIFNKNLIKINKCACERHLVKDIEYVSRTLGLNVRVSTKISKRKNICVNSLCDKYICITIYGNILKIPIRTNKHGQLKSTYKSTYNGEYVVNKIPIKSITSIGVGDYYGFNTDGNHRFVLGDFTSTHNCMDFVRYNDTKHDSWCVYSADADLIMLALATHEKQFYVLRENIYQKYNKEYFIVNIGELRVDLLATVVPVERAKGMSERNCCKIINDFVLLCFFVGNDFLPHIPTIEIKDGGIDIILKLYQDFGEYITLYDKYNNIYIKKDNFVKLLDTISSREEYMLNQRVNSDNYSKCFPFPCLDNNTKWNENKSEKIVDFKGFRKQYYKEKFNIDVDVDDIKIKNVVFEYLEGIQWVLSYYNHGVSNWNWKYPHQYAPFLIDIKNYISKYRQPIYGVTAPNEPFMQLLSVLPPTSKSLIPTNLQIIFTTLCYMYPTEFVVDTDGKRYEYEGVINIPFIDDKKLQEEFNKFIDLCSTDEKKRNIQGGLLIYK
jgi:hypothetical protein